MDSGHSQFADRIAFKIELYEDNWLIANYPAVVPGFNDNKVWSLKLQRAAIGKLHVNFSLCEKSDVRVHAEIGADKRFDVTRPAEAGRIDDSFYTADACPDDIDPHTGYVPVVHSVQGRKQRIF